MKIKVKSRDAVELLLQVALIEGLEINVKPIQIITPYLNIDYHYEVEISEVKE